MSSHIHTQQAELLSQTAFELMFPRQTALHQTMNEKDWFACGIALFPDDYSEIISPA
jgi:hypothetical protein